MGWAFVQLVVCDGWAEKGHIEYAVGRELRGQVRVVYARKKTEDHKAPRSGTFLCLLSLGVQRK